MNIQKYLQNLINKLNPDRTAEDRIKEQVFARLNLEVPQRKLNLFDLFAMNKKVIIGTLSLTAVGIFVGLPIMIGALGTGYGTTSLESGLLPQKSNVLVDENKDYATVPAPSMGNVANDTYEAVTELFNREDKEDTDTKEAERAKEKWAELYLRVNNVSETITTIYELTGTVEGYVISSDYSTGSNEGRGTITIRVPSDKFDYTIKELRGYSVEVLSESTNIVDIQNEITDNENSLTELRKQLADEYAKLETAKTENEKINIQNKINQLENQIEIYEEQASELEQRASYSTIDIELTQEAEEVGNDLDDVFTKAWNVAKLILEFWARITIWGVFIIPPVALPVLAFFAVKKFINSRRKN